VKDLYLFNIALLNKKEYNPQDEMFLQLLFNPLGQISDKEALIKYEIYGVDENGSIDQPLLELNDKIELAENKAFLKKIKLQKEITGNEYFIKVMAYIGGNEYVQSAKFGIAPKILLQVGEVKIDQDKFSKIIVWNSLVVVGFAIIVLLLMIFEYHQMSQSDLINAKMLKKRHYFS
jgi:hypothetical protein